MEGFNPALTEIHQRCDASGKGAELRDGLARFATGGGVYDPLFQGAGPLPDGSFRPDRVERNLAALAGEDPDAWLIQLMHDYIGFALVPGRIASAARPGVAGSRSRWPSS